MCDGANYGPCSARTPEPEVCDYQDNDCNGVVDEGFVDANGSYSSNQHCGVCGQTCDGVIANATSACDADTYSPPQCVVSECDAGFYPINDLFCGAVPAKLCNECASDAACSSQGGACTSFEDGSYCTVPCSGSGECPEGYSCALVEGNTHSQCIPTSGSCACDVENTGLQRACEATVQDTSNPDAPLTTCVGFETCMETGWSTCAFGADVCDYLDNDCDGVVDGPWINTEGKYDQDEHCGVCGNNCLAADAPANSVQFCDATGEVPQCALACDEAPMEWQPAND